MSGYTLVYLNQLNPNVPFFKVTAVRQALLYALDRQGLIDSELHGQGRVANSPILPGTWAYDPDVPKYGYDRAQGAASCWIRQAGRPAGDGVREQNGKKLSFILVGVGQDQALLQALAKAWSQIGVQAVPQTVTSAGLSADFLVPRTLRLR